MTRKLIKIAVALAGLLLLAVIALVALRNPVARAVALANLRDSTGLAVELKKFEIGFGQPTVRLEGLVLPNPPGFGDGPLLSLPEVFLELDPEAARQRRLRFRQVRFHLGELHIVEDAAGRTNILTLQDDLERRGDLKQSLGEFKFDGIDALTVTLDRVRFTSLKPGGKNWDLTLNIHNETLRDVKSEKDLLPLAFRLVMQGVLGGIGGTNRGIDFPSASGGSGDR